MRMYYFDEGDARARRKGKINGKVEGRAVGYFHTLPTMEQKAAVLVAMEMRAALRIEARADLGRRAARVLRLQARAGVVPAAREAGDR
eukprot:5736324-Pleurochrysis_carterae.AAC.1